MSSGPLFSGIAASILTPMVIGWMVNSTRDVAAGRDGWKRVRPGGAIFATILSAAAFSLGAFYVYFFVGSARSDAERQMFYCLMIALAFGFGAIVLTFQAFWRNLSWQGRTIRVTTLAGGDRRARIDDIVSIDYSVLRSSFLIRFADGWSVEASPYMHGTQQLLRHIDRLMPGLAASPQPGWEDGA